MTIDQAVDAAVDQVRRVLKDRERARITKILVDARTSDGLLDHDQLDREIGRVRALDEAWLANEIAPVLRKGLEDWLIDEPELGPNITGVEIIHEPDQPE